MFSIPLDWNLVFSTIRRQSNIVELSYLRTILSGQYVTPRSSQNIRLNATFLTGLRLLRCRRRDWRSIQLCCRPWARSYLVPLTDGEWERSYACDDRRVADAAGQLDNQAPWIIFAMDHRTSWCAMGNQICGRQAISLYER